MQKIILSDKGIIISIKINEPIPSIQNTKQDSGAVKRGREIRRPIVEHIVRLPNHMNILRSYKDRHRFDRNCQSLTFGLLSRTVKVEEVVIPWMINGVKKTNKPARVVGGSGYEVGE